MNILKLIKSLHPKATNAKLEQMVFGRSTNSWSRDIRLLEKELVKRNEQLNRVGLEVIVREKNACYCERVLGTTKDGKCLNGCFHEKPTILCDLCQSTPVEKEGEWCQTCQILP